MDIVEKYGGYRKLDSFTLVTIIQLGTWKFCSKFLNYQNDPKGRQFDQMTQAARSGRANIIEGSERAGTSKTTEIRLTDVARASLAELKGDYEFWLLSNYFVPWHNSCVDAREVYAVSFDKSPPGVSDGLHESGAYLLDQFSKFSNWLDSDDANVVANTMIILLNRALNMLNRQLEAQSNSFKKDGGFHERAGTIRRQERERQNPNEVVPKCPECGKLMCIRIAKSSKNEGVSFWGCTGFPECKATKKFKS
jgi:restriction system protein